MATIAITGTLRRQDDTGWDGGPITVERLDVGMDGESLYPVSSQTFRAGAGGALAFELTRTGGRVRITLPNGSQGAGVYIVTVPDEDEMSLPELIALGINEDDPTWPYVAARIDERVAESVPPAVEAEVAAQVPPAVEAEIASVLPPAVEAATTAEVTTQLDALEAEAVTVEPLEPATAELQIEDGVRTLVIGTPRGLSGIGLSGLSGAVAVPEAEFGGITERADVAYFVTEGGDLRAITEIAVVEEMPDPAEPTTLYLTPL